MRLLSIILLCLFFLSAFGTTAQDKLLVADFRQRPPEMVIGDGDGDFYGPLKIIIEIAANRAGLGIEWRLGIPFARSIRNLKSGVIDILPRTIRNKEREAFANFLGPIGYQQKDILFLVKKGQEELINNYDDLYELKIEVKRGTAYFKRFDEDLTLSKYEANDDENMVKMFSKGRFDTMPVLDKSSLEHAMLAISFDDYSYANYRHVQRVGNYYAMSKRSSNAELYPDLNKILLDMVGSGEVAEIYQKYDLEPPLIEP